MPREAPVRHEPAVARRPSAAAPGPEEAAGGAGGTAGLRFARHFTQAGDDGTKGIEWTTRDVTIADPDGRAVFEAKAVEVPASWSRLATDVLASKYLRLAGVLQPDGSTGAEASVRQVVDRIVLALDRAGRRLGYFASDADAQTFAAELRHLLLAQRGAFNSPVWFNLGLHEAYGITDEDGHFAWDHDAGRTVAVPDAYERPQCSACFIQSVHDSLVGPGGIFDLLKSEAKLFKYGSGTGTNFSRLRAGHERLRGGGTSSGLLSFLRVFDQAAGATKSGGTTRRAAKMVVVDADHPEILDFIGWKAAEERRARALVAAGYAAEAGTGVDALGLGGQNANHSVRVSDAFMDAVERDGTWTTLDRTTGGVHATLQARDVWQAIAQAAWECADPGVQFHDTINHWHTCKASGPISASNPCSEYLFLDDSACNLASLDLLRFRAPDGGFDVDAFRHAVRIFVVAQDILVSHAGYPTARIAENSERFRPLGLGYADLGALLMVSGLPYDSPTGRSLAAAVTSLLAGYAYRVSAELAAALGPFAGLSDADGGRSNRDSMAAVLEKHLAAAERLVASGQPGEDGDPSGNGTASAASGRVAAAVARAALEDWQAAAAAGNDAGPGWRNAQVTVLAPTGTIGLLMDCDTTGVEPEFALVKWKKLAGGGAWRIINQSVPAALTTLGYDERERDAIVAHVAGHRTLEGGPIDKHPLIEHGVTEADYQEAYDHVARTGRFDEWTPGMSPQDLRRLGFDAEAVDALVRHVEGHHTVEGSLVQEEHLAVFDCANRCGDGTRAIAPMGHVHMMAAVQPFLSGAISKTVNMPRDASVADIENVYREAWRSGLKAIAVYRDGSKVMQPLSGGLRQRSAPAPPAAHQVASSLSPPPTRGPQAMARGEQLHAPRDNDMGFKRTVTIFTPHGPEKVDIQVWEYDDGTPAEVFVGARRSGTMVDDFLKEMGKNYSRILQLGMDLDGLTKKMIQSHGPLAGHTDHPYIKRCLGIQDLLGKLLRYEYFGETSFLSRKPDPEDPEYVPPRREMLARLHRMRRPGESTLEAFAVGDEAGPGEAAAGGTQQRGPGSAGPTRHDQQAGPAESASSVAAGPAGLDAFLAGLGGDCPPCDQCGHTTILSGACYRCLNCGSAMGCS